MKGGGADVDVLLRGNAVNKRLIEKGAKVYLVADDAADRGLEGTDLVDGLERVPRQGIAALCANYDQVWHW